MICTYLGIDIGTSAIKAILVNERGEEVVSASVPLTTTRLHPSWSEQEVDQWWGGVIAAMTELWKDQRVDKSTLKGIGLTGQMHGAVLLDSDCRPLRSAILWNDGRAVNEAAYLQERFPLLAKEVGVLPMPGLTAPKLLWLASNEPDVMEKTRWLLSPKDYIRYRLTGEIATDYSDAAGTWLLDQERRVWSKAAVNAVGLSLSQLPPLVESDEVCGHLTGEAAKLLGIAADLPVAGGGGDTPVGAIGFGCVKAGDAVVSLGTSAHIFSPTVSYKPAVESVVHSFCHALPDLWYQMGAMLNGASAFGWVCSLLGEDAGVVDARLHERYDGPGDMLFLPYLTGERTPHNNPHARGVFFGLSPTTDRESLCQSVMEGVAYSIADGRDALTGSGTVIQRAAIGGGGAKSRIWAQIIASVLNIPIIRYRGKERGPAFGAARLARLAVEGGNPYELCREPEIEEVLDPDQSYVGHYRENHQRFKRLYRQLRSEFQGEGGDVR
ncbi:xylulokinase [Desulfopila aestuarii]|uniref:Xylulose kinase n=1 Tax=Desulfopila aestuarii DSM 18488 TaxID=1121416 RepID=A0A1M7XVN7_9BACT|nr:xylulokinase [Desulfopila aestuarii]SHO42727.1 xylulokinase [Desulfopila aestuarii DSM 18488]